VGSYYRDEDIYLQIKCRLNFIPKNLIFGIPFWSSDETMITAFNADLDGFKFKIPADGVLSGILQISPGLNPDTYKSVLAVHDGAEYLLRTYLPPLEIRGKHQRILGVINISHTWHFDSADHDEENREQ
jgi:hypothetical protein